MTFLKGTSNFNKHVWAERLKHVFIVMLAYLAFIYLLSKAHSTANFHELLQINFTQANYRGFLIPYPIFYILIEEYAFRVTVNRAKFHAILAAVIMLILSIHQFSSEAFSFYLFSIYGLVLLIQLNNQSPSNYAVSVGFLISLSALCTFHLLKFDLSELSINQQLIGYLLPIFVLGTLQFLLKQRHTSLESLLTYLIIYLISDGL